MTTVKYMTGSQGISKRFQLNDELSGTSFQEIDEILLPVVRKGLQKVESNEEYSNTNDASLRSDKLKDLYNDTGRIEVIDSCIDVSAKHSFEKCSLVKIYNETENFINSKETDKMVDKQTCKLENDQSLKDLKKPYTVCFKTIDLQTRRESSGTLSESLPHRSLKKDDAEISIHSVKPDLPVLNEICNNLKESTKRNISVEKNANLIPIGDMTNESLKNDKLRNLQQEGCNNKTVSISGEFSNKMEYPNDGRVCLEESNKNSFSLKSNGTLKENKEIEVKKVRSLEESKSDAVKSLEVSKAESTFPMRINITKSKLYSHDYKMFSNVIQKARDKVIQRTSQPSNNISGGKSQSTTNPNTLNETSECSRMRLGKDYKFKLTTVLVAMEEMEEFLDFCQEALTHMISHFVAVRGIVQFLSVEAEYIEIILQDGPSEEIAAEKNQLNDDAFKITAGLFIEIQKVGKCLLSKIIELSKTWGRATDMFKTNLDIVTDTVYNFC